MIQDYAKSVFKGRIWAKSQENTQTTLNNFPKIMPNTTLGIGTAAREIAERWAMTPTYDLVLHGIS